MVIEKRLDEILDTKSKVKVIRLFVSRREDYMASGREIAKLIGVTPPAVHTALKDLLNQDILRRDIIGRQHIYRINPSSRIVKYILKPTFQKEVSVKDDMGKFLLGKIKEHNITRSIESLLIYGSIAKDETHLTSDCDIAIVVKDASSKQKIESLFIDTISNEFSDYFTTHLDTYIKTKSEFLKLLKGKRPPVSTLMKSHIIVYGKDPAEYK
jgi:predicted nucleotidyltransferase